MTPLPPTKTTPETSEIDNVSVSTLSASFASSGTIDIPALPAGETFVIVSILPGKQVEQEVQSEMLATHAAVAVALVVAQVRCTTENTLRRAARYGRIHSIYFKILKD